MRLRVVAFILGTVIGCGPQLSHRPRLQPGDIGVTASRFSRVWVAGFVTSNNPEFDLNLETVRVLNARLRHTFPIPLLDRPPIDLDIEARFGDFQFWKRLGEERGEPLIVTGSVALLLAPPAVVQRGPRTRYIPRAGRVLRASVVLIDGRTGTVLTREELPTRVRYGGEMSTSALSLYFQLMDDSLPDWLNAIALARLPAAASQRHP